MMDPLVSVEARVGALEDALRRTRRTAVVLASAVAILVLSAMMPRERSSVEVEKLVLTDSVGEPSVVLTAGPESSLVIETPSGEEVLRIGGPSMRWIGR